jgi:hypothetical protein
MPIAFLYTQRALDEVGGYDETLEVAGDWDFNLRFVEKFDIAYVGSTVANYHVRPQTRGDMTDNSISRMETHHFYRTLILNRYVRKAMEEGNISMAHLIAATDTARDINRLGEKLAYSVPRFKRFSFLRKLLRMKGEA